MLTSFFGKSRPINYILLSLGVIIGYFFGVLMAPKLSLSPDSITTQGVVVFLMVFAVLLLDFIIRKNNVTKNNNFVILLFVLFVLLVPQVYNAPKLILANIFVLLATRRILSLTTEKNTIKKIFDATMYITLASFCYGWAILFFVVLYPAIINKTKFNITYVFIPIVGFLGITSIAVAYQFVVTDSYSWLYLWIPERDFDLSAYSDTKLLITTVLLLGLLLWMGIVRLSKLGSLSKKERPSAITILLIAIISVGIVLAKAQKNGSELFFVFAPIAAVTSNFIESRTSKTRRMFSDVFLWSLFVLVVVLPFI
ncbi:MAG: hypothetical protein QMC45_03195 [Patiriisocius sp.]|jgi:hypothetical protein|tara:strand:- start:43 stop:975 length:933 start_codon:yes stop_codon:yes gene_type:complete